MNAPREESLLSPIETGALRNLLPGPSTLVTDSARWASAVFSAGQGPEIWRWLLLAAVLVLVVESLVAASGPSSDRSRSGAASGLPGNRIGLTCLAAFTPSSKRSARARAFNSSAERCRAEASGAPCPRPSAQPQPRR